MAFLKSDEKLNQNEIELNEKTDRIEEMINKYNQLADEYQQFQNSAEEKDQQIQEELKEKDTELDSIKGSLDEVNRELENEKSARRDYEIKSKEEFDSYVKEAQQKIEEESKLRRQVEEELNQARAQLEHMGLSERKKLAFHKGIIEGKLPLSIGGGIGQSRLCMFLLQKAHIGEVQSSVWPEDVVKDCESKGIVLL